MTTTTDRVERERDFHDHAFEHAVREPLGKYYAVTQSSNRHYEALLANIPAGGSVLEYGCGEGSQSFRLAARCVVTGIDISPVGVEHARDEARRLGLTTATYEVMDAEALTFADSTFDAVCGSGILHHLDLHRAFTEVARVLKPGGEAVFAEPLGHNPLINLFRKRTPKFRSPDEHPLLVSDLEMARRSFRTVDCEYFNVVTLATVPLRSTPLFNPSLRICELVDRTLFKVIPRARRFAWIIVIRCAGPHASAP